MSSRIVDLSIPLENDRPSDPEGFHPHIQYVDHRQSAQAMCSFFPGLRPDQLPDGEGWALERLQLSTHNGTHLDAPYHFASTMNGGQPAMTIDQVPLDWCFRPGVKVDLRHLPDGCVAQPSDLEEALQGYTLQPLDIVLVNTRAGDVFGQEGYVDAGCGMGREATLYLLERGVRITGTDGWSWDAPFSHTARSFAENPDPAIIWEGHRVGRDVGYCHLEKLHNLEQLPFCGFTVACFPVKIHAASAGWTRAVAIFP